jgi:hypothetical protein
VGCGVLILLVAPLVFHYLLHDRFEIGPQLLLLAIGIGLVRVWEGFSSTLVSALGSPRRMAQLSVIAWTCLGLATVGAILAAPFGLAGVLYGTLAAWIVLAGAGTWLARVILTEHCAPRPDARGAAASTAT